MVITYLEETLNFGRSFCKSTLVLASIVFKFSYESSNILYTSFSCTYDLDLSSIVLNCYIAFLSFISDRSTSCLSFTSTCGAFDLLLIVNLLSFTIFSTASLILIGSQIGLYSNFHISGKFLVKSTFSWRSNWTISVFILLCAETIKIGSSDGIWISFSFIYSLGIENIIDDSLSSS